MNEEAVNILNPFVQYGVIGILAIFFAYIIYLQNKEYKRHHTEIKKERDELRQWKDDFYEERFKEYEDIIQNNTTALYEQRSMMGQINEVLKEILKKGINN
jgi:hypothetical protein